jgi:hypothetical protein
MIIDPKFPMRERMLTEHFDPVFTFSLDFVKDAYKFACDCAATNKDKYARRGQSNLTNIIDQIRTGKIVEQMTYDKLVPYFSNLSKPDWNIYGSKQKNWDADLSDRTTDPITQIGVKSQRVNVGESMGTSWIFEFRAGKNYDVDTGVFGAEAKKPGHYIAFSSIDVMKRQGSIHAIVAVSTLHDLQLFEMPKIERLRDNKVAVYLETLEKKLSV